MGWCSGTEIFDSMFREITFNVDNYDTCFKLVKELAFSLERLDWDCQSDSEYYDDPLVQKVFKELHPDWFEDENKNELMLTINDLQKQLEKVTKERNELARMAYLYAVDYEIYGNELFIEKYIKGYYK